VTHLLEHTTVPKIESFRLLFKVSGFEENVLKLFIFSNAVCSEKDTIRQYVLANDTK
jgi:hypothetical protein